MMNGSRSSAQITKVRQAALLTGRFCEIAVSNNVGGVKHFSSILLHALEEERHFALVDVCAFQPGLASNRWGQELSPTHPSLRSQPRS